MAMILGKKVGMTQIYDKTGNLVPVTVIQADPCVVMQVKTTETDGYNAIQLGFDEVKECRRKKPQIGHSKKFLFSIEADIEKDLDKADIPDELRREFKQHKISLSGDITVSVEQAGSKWFVSDESAKYPVRKEQDKIKVYAFMAPKKFAREMRLPDDPEQQYEPGDSITVSVFAEEKTVDVVGTSKGKGFAGVMKRHGFGGFPASHGTERKHRAAGSISSFASDAGHGPGPKKGKRMAGHMGHCRVTAKNHELIAIDEDQNLLVVKGSVPGPAGGYCVVRSARKA